MSDSFSRSRKTQTSSLGSVMAGSMDGYLTQLSDNAAPSDEYIKRGNQMMDKLFRALQADGTYSIDRLRLAGGLEKKTSTSLSSLPDYDVVCFLNDVMPDINVLKHFKGVIRREFNLKGKKKRVRICIHSLQFALQGVEFDLLFAKNMVPKNSRGSPTEVQHARLLKLIKKSDNPLEAAAMNTAGLTEAAVEFVKQQTTFVHKVARLAKYWNATISWSPKIRVSGRSTIFELLGITAGINEEKRAKPSIANAFKAFLEMVASLKSQSITHYEFYNQSDVPNKILKKKPLILDPSSPYNNLMCGFPRMVMQLFSECATESLGSFDEDIDRAVHMHSGKPKVVRPRKNRKTQKKKKLQSQFLPPPAFKTTMSFY